MASLPRGLSAMETGLVCGNQFGNVVSNFISIMAPLTFRFIHQDRYWLEWSPRYSLQWKKFTLSNSIIWKTLQTVAFLVHLTPWADHFPKVLLYTIICTAAKLYHWWSISFSGSYFSLKTKTNSFKRRLPFSFKGNILIQWHVFWMFYVCTKTCTC